MEKISVTTGTDVEIRYAESGRARSAVEEQAGFDRAEAAAPSAYGSPDAGADSEGICAGMDADGIDQPARGSEGGIDDGDAPEARRDECHLDSHELGRKGERAVRAYLIRQGYEIVDMNWTCFAGEVDIIAYDDDELVFVEVKTRTSLKAGFPEDSVDRRKRQRHENIALAYLAEHELPSGRIRFDVIALVVIDDGHAMIRHHRDAFACGE